MINLNYDCTTLDGFRDFTSYSAGHEFISDGDSIVLSNPTLLDASSDMGGDFAIDLTAPLEGDFEIRMNVTIPDYSDIVTSNDIDADFNIYFKFADNIYIQSLLTDRFIIGLRQNSTTNDFMEIVTETMIPVTLPWTGDIKLKRTGETIYLYIDNTLLVSGTDNYNTKNFTALEIDTYYEPSTDKGTYPLTIPQWKINDVSIDCPPAEEEPEPGPESTEIWTPEDLNNVRNDLLASYIQMADIDLVGYENWVPIGTGETPFLGAYNGNNFTITNLNINSPGLPRMGLFGQVGSTDLDNPIIENVHLVGASITGSFHVGSLVGFLSEGNLENCSATGTVSGSSMVGGLVGRLSRGISNSHAICTVTATGDTVGGLVGDSNNADSYIENSFSVGDVSGANQVGGLVGRSLGGRIDYCYSIGAVVGSSQKVGGLIGDHASTTVRNSYHIGDVTGTSFVGGLLGSANTNSLTNGIQNCYSAGSVSIGANTGGLIGFLGNFDPKPVKCFYDKDLTTHTDTNKGTPKTTAEMKTQATFVDWDFTTPIWAIDTSGIFNDGYPLLSNVSILIYTPEQLNKVRNNLSGSYIQMADIDLSGYTNWTPIGTFSTPFKGSYDGGNYDISNLSIEGTSTIGLFGYMKDATIRNCDIQGTVTGTGAVGILTGAIRDSNIINCHVGGSVTGTLWHVGGLIGCVYSNSIIKNCNADISITSVSTTYNHNVGGLIGSIYEQNNEISYCYSTGDVIGGDSTGGLIGYIETGNLIKKCYSVAIVEAVGGYVGQTRAKIGGLVGECLGSEIRDCYSKGTVTGMQKAGGFIGHIASSNISNCYTTNSVTGTSQDGYGPSGFVSSLQDTQISNCYFNIETSGQEDSHAVGKTTEELQVQSTFVNWDFLNIWGLDPSVNEGYPCFLWQLGPVLPKTLKNIIGWFAITDTGLKQATSVYIITEDGLKEITGSGIIV